MNPSSKGWIKKYFSLVENHQEELMRFVDSGLSAEEIFYAYIQPTGFLYGYPTDFLFLGKEYLTKFTAEESFKVLLLEGLILVYYSQQHKNEKILSIDKLIEKFITFYEDTDIEIFKKSLVNFSKVNPYDKLEKIILKRVKIKSKLANKLVTGYLYNSLLFHDLLMFKDYINNVSLEILKEKRKNSIFDLIRIIGASANSNNSVSKHEKGIFKMFLASANLDKKTKNLALDYLNKGDDLSSISIQKNDSWLLKRYALEISILTLWSDDEVDEDEHRFLDKLVEKLGVTEEEKDKSFIAIQSFLISNKNKALFLGGKNDFELMMKGASRRWTKILSRNKDKLALELRESKELMQLIKKSTTTDLSDEEKEKVKAQFLDLGKTIPALSLFMLPGGAVILPIVLKIIPTLIPSAFRENYVDEKKKSEEEE